ncbi:hypothetical protein L2E82_29986 [Cichorium intybus]|uniref:Uncharacterized protein n=1 Tax=Cichorium intybus TaxID=13427 RepID=A0ACB9CZ46_CICIN|nr:hypothetical protein L2E82_29986 [Cichorium intybus]
MEPGIRSKEKIWTRTGEGGKEEILKETKDHPLSAIDKEQLLDMLEMMEARHQQYERESKKQEANVFELLKSQQQWIRGVNDRMTQLTSLMTMMANNFMPEYQQMPSRGQEEEEGLDHPFLQFPAELASSVEYTSRRDALTRRRVLEATVIDRDILRDAGL